MPIVRREWLENERCFLSNVVATAALDQPGGEPAVYGRKDLRIQQP